MNAKTSPPSYDDVLGSFGPNKLGMVDKESGRRLVIVAETNKQKHTISVEIVNAFNADQTKISTEFWLIVRPPGKPGSHVTVKSSSVRTALKGRQDVVATAIHDQFLWFAQNFPGLCPELIERAGLQGHIPVPAKSSGKKRI